MPNTREKLIELLSAVQYQGNAVHGFHDKYILNSELADHLIANGVTVQEWIAVDKNEHSYTGNRIIALCDGLVTVGY